MDIYYDINYNKINKICKNREHILIPKGKKYFIYFTYDDFLPCVKLYDKNKKFIKKIYLCFDEVLSSGTIMYGTFIKNTFIVEYLCYYKGSKVKHDLNNFNKIGNILDTYISNIDNLIKVKIPFIDYNNVDIYTYTNVSYPVYGILEYGLNNKFNIFPLNKLMASFIIKKNKTLKYVYNLYLKNEDIYTKAYVNDMKTSYLLNELFCETKNYKNIEYSDDEDENEEENKIGDIYVTCIYINTLKKWKPYMKCNNNKVDTINYVKNIENLYIN